MDMSALAIQFFRQKNIYSQLLHGLRVQSAKQQTVFQDLVLSLLQHHCNAEKDSVDRLGSLTEKFSSIVGFPTSTSLDESWNMLRELVDSEYDLRRSYQINVEEIWRSLSRCSSAATHELQLLFAEARALEERTGSKKTDFELSKSRLKKEKSRYYDVVVNHTGAMVSEDEVEVLASDANAHPEVVDIHSATDADEIADNLRYNHLPGLLTLQLRQGVSTRNIVSSDTMHQDSSNLTGFDKALKNPSGSSNRIVPAAEASRIVHARRELDAAMLEHFQAETMFRQSHQAYEERVPVIVSLSREIHRRRLCKLKSCMQEMVSERRRVLEGMMSQLEQFEKVVENMDVEKDMDSFANVQQDTNTNKLEKEDESKVMSENSTNTESGFFSFLSFQKKFLLMA